MPVAHKTRYVVEMKHRGRWVTLASFGTRAMAEHEANRLREEMGRKATVRVVEVESWL